MATDKPRYTVSVDNELFQKIEDFRFERRFQTRSEATVELIRLGLEQLKKEEEEAKKAQKNKQEKIGGLTLEFSKESDRFESGLTQPVPAAAEKETGQTVEELEAE